MTDPWPVTIRTVTHSPKQTKIKIIDWNDSSDRKWLQNHTHWAMNNSATITLNATTSYDTTIHEIASRGAFGTATIAG